MTLTMIVELLIVLAALYVGSRYGSLALGAISGIGLAILVFGFGLKPGTPPTDVIYIIIAAVTCAGTLQASGGMDWMIQIAEKMLRKHPDHITFLGPLVTFFLTVLVGTGHVVYTIMPIICHLFSHRRGRGGFRHHFQRQRLHGKHSPGAHGLPPGLHDRPDVRRRSLLQARQRPGQGP